MSAIPLVEWRALIYDDRVDYDVSSTGLIRSAGHRIIEPRLRDDGHLWVCLEGKGRFRSYKVAFLVALVYHGERPSPKHVLGFRDFDRGNCRADNVHWVLSTDYPRRVKLTPAMRAEIRASKETTDVLARRFRVGRARISLLRRGRIWGTDTLEVA